MTPNDDDLREAFAALRDETGGASRAAPATRRAIVRVASTRRHRKLVVLRVAPIAAALAASSAWAATTDRLPSILAGAASVLGIAHGSPPPAALPPPAAAPPPIAPVEEPPPAIAPTVAAPAPPPKAYAPRVAVVDAEEALYRRAHEAHFVRKDPARALEAWDAYLAKYPLGRFSPEARYNRALSLVRLGRRDEAREALRAFADGRFGDYRRREAHALLDALGP